MPSFENWNSIEDRTLFYLLTDGEKKYKMKENSCQVENVPIRR